MGLSSDVRFLVSVFSVLPVFFGLMLLYFESHRHTTLAYSVILIGLVPLAVVWVLHYFLWKKDYESGLNHWLLNYAGKDNVAPSVINKRFLSLDATAKHAAQYRYENCPALRAELEPVWADYADDVDPESTTGVSPFTGLIQHSLEEQQKREDLPPEWVEAEITRLGKDRELFIQMMLSGWPLNYEKWSEELDTRRQRRDARARPEEELPVEVETTSRERGKQFREKKRDELNTLKDFIDDFGEKEGTLLFDQYDHDERALERERKRKLREA